MAERKPKAYINALSEGPKEEILEWLVKVDAENDELRAKLTVHSETETPLPMVLHCPNCKAQHIDAPQPATGWTNPPHRSHECQFCGCTWRPADVPTNGVAKIRTKGKKDWAL